MTHRSTRRIGITIAAVAAALGVAIGPANAASGPAIKPFTTAVPIIGSTLSDSSDQPTFPIKDGWSIYDPNGVCSAYANFYGPGVGSSVWRYTGSRSTQTVTGKYQWNIQVTRYGELYISATNCLGNTATTYAYTDPSMQQEGGATYSAGWSSGSCSCWSGGAAMKSTKVGATANFSFSGRMVSFVSDKASTRGSASLYIDGKFLKTVSLKTSGATVNRAIVWNSPYLSNTGSHILTVKVASGRVDIDAFILQ